MAHQPSANVVTVLNLKGGVGKTHTSWLLASVCMERQQRILLARLVVALRVPMGDVDAAGSDRTQYRGLRGMYGGAA